MWNFTVVREISRIKPISVSDLPLSTYRMQSASRGETARETALPERAKLSPLLINMYR